MGTLVAFYNKTVQHLVELRREPATTSIPYKCFRLGTRLSTWLATLDNIEEKNKFNIVHLDALYQESRELCFEVLKRKKPVFSEESYSAGVEDATGDDTLLQS